jgi:hypothetical protein
MTDLRYALIAFGVVLVVVVVIYNVVTERRARAKAEKAFGGRPPDALFDAPGARREPTLGAIPQPVTTALDRTLPPTSSEDLEAELAPAAQISSRIDTVAVVLADDPIMSEQLAPLLGSLESHRNPTHVEGIVDEQWHPVDTSPRRSWRELRVGLQLASRKGAVTEEEIERFNHAISEFAAGVNAVSQREAPGTAAARARDLDRFCADADVEVAVNVIGQFGATFGVARVKALALENGLSETASGDLVRYTPEGDVGFVIRRFEEAHAKPNASYYAGLTFALDLPNVADASRVLSEMVRVAEIFATTLTGQLVDDNRKPLSEAGIAIIRRSLEGIVKDMEAHGIPAGSALARRLFS